MKNTTVKIILFYILLCLIWGSTWLAIRFGLESLTPLFSAGIRFTIASAFIFILMKLIRFSSNRQILLRLYFMLFFSFVIPFDWFIGRTPVPSGGAVLFAVYPFRCYLFIFPDTGRIDQHI
jgi:drug/metabolite transporter (DMT)-like permease